ncbi:ABC transporter permease [Vulcanisaeta distributa]|uniref:ABC-2 type transporter n=1 Tax=Vulcanisaeta distributa (strain DSM 14429 / JCM 11212 / NBRC 100878 / IC-017) TaxID=572478 RepID=E1QTT3_VULDI|nr:ABC transporter permease [Vulcanisaeta distributa]ADN51000.1 ABC-2 type transporter [Vulcanisaeta distributa DSM 14429]
MSNFINAILAFVELETRRLKYNRTELYTRAVQPILWLVVFGPVMARVRALPTGGIPYIAFITPGVIMQSVTFVSIFYGLTIVWERESGILKKLLTMPVSRMSIVLGRSSASIIRALFQFIIITPIAIALGVRIEPNPIYLLLSLFIVMITAIGFSAFSIWIASHMKTRERFMGIGQAITMPLFFASNAIYPISIMPVPIKIFVLVNPLTYAVDALRKTMIIGSLNGLVIDLLALTIFTVLFIILASIEFRRIIE